MRLDKPTIHMGSTYRVSSTQSVPIPIPLISHSLLIVYEAIRNILVYTKYTPSL